MLTLHSILQHICQFFRGLAVKATKRMYRSSAVFMAGAAVITVVAFTSTGFGSGGKSALTAFAETPGQETAAEEEDAEEEDQRSNKEKILELYRQGKSNIEIAKRLNLGVGEVNLVLGLFKG